MSRFLLHFFLLLPILGAANTPAPKKIETTQVTFRTVVRSLHLLGVVKAKRASHLFAQVDGNLDIPERPPKAQVKKNQIIATLNNEDLKTHFELAQSSEHIAAVHYQRLKKLHQSNSISLGAVEEAQEKLIQAQITLNKAKKDLDKTCVKAPFDGTLSPFLVTEGAMIKTGEALVTLYDTSSFVVEFFVAPAILPQLSLEQPLTLKDTSGKIIEIQKAVDPKTHMGLVRALLNTCSKCLIDQAIEIQIVLQQKDKALAIPNESIFLHNGSPHVYWVKQDEVILTPIKIGLEGDKYTEVIEGLQPDVAIVTTNPSRLWSHAKVKTS